MDVLLPYLYPDPAEEFERKGFEIVASLLPPEVCDQLSTELTEIHETQRQQRPERLGGLRNILRLSPLADRIARSGTVLDVVRTRLSPEPFPVRAIFFDKTPEANWSVAWHQDLSIAVAQRIDTPGFSAWSSKEGVTHVQPPVEVLERMVTVRIHLDDCPAENGALKVIAGSHRRGRLSPAEKAAATERETGTVCEARKGDALLMRPLLLHSSSPSSEPGHRRVLHIEYANAPLTDGLEWYDLALRDCAAG